MDTGRCLGVLKGCLTFDNAQAQCEAEHGPVCHANPREEWPWRAGGVSAFACFA